MFMSVFNSRCASSEWTVGARVSECTSIVDISPCGGGVKRRRMKLVAAKSDMLSTLPFSSGSAILIASTRLYRGWNATAR